MDGLLLAEVVSRLADLLPSARTSWRFPEGLGAELTLASGHGLRLDSRPGRPRLELTAPGGSASADGGPPAAASRRRPTAFQAQLAARAGGELLSVAQMGLDRVVVLEFAASDGFVPTPGVALVFELTGNHANLALRSDAGEVIAVERTSKVPAGGARAGSRARLTPGADYAPPAPQAKLDPRAATSAELAAALVDRRFGDVRRLVDGVGPTLQAALQAATRHAPDAVIDQQAAAVLAGEIAAMALAPTAYVERHLQHDEPSAAGALGRGRDSERLTAAVAKAIGRRLKTVAARRADAEAALRDEQAAGRLRAEADLLLAQAADAPAGADAIEVAGFDGASVRLALDPAMSAAENAQERYRLARRSEAKARAATTALPGLIEAERDLAAELGALAGLGEAELEERLEALSGHGGRATRPQRERGARVGTEFLDARGFTVIVGRGAKDNDALTFKLAKSRDVWLHAQGYRGAHVVIRAASRQVPFETILFAARLAAGHSEARGSDNVAVDYTERKNVWRPKGGAPGAVHFAHHKTVFVTPARDAAAAEGS